ncbi:multicopper oxidase family protein [Zavarzinia sp. CC-PAN008]|uniref:multicopper oxidase family protein n=1 Tax=Zavarzinia sp. CC-PAN008 TaxID=3243332 RepID=UPI003F7480EF
MRLTRRALLGGAGVLGLGAAAGGTRHLLPPAWAAPALDVTLEARATALPLVAGAAPTPGFGYRLGGAAQDGPYPVLRLRQHQRLRATLLNSLAEHTSVHWHGIRLPHAMDGVPWLTQDPVHPGERFTYDFTVPDTGTFFFHPHCDTVSQLGRGLAGVLIVDGDADNAPFDADILAVVKDWYVDAAGNPAPLTSAAGASKAGTFGAVATVNGIVAPDYTVPPGGDVRLRVLNIDNTRVMQVGLEGAEAWVIAVDGNPVEPWLLKTWRLGPAMRLDLHLRAGAAGSTVTLTDWFAAQPRRLARLRAQGPALARPAFAPRALRAAEVPVPDLEQAETLPMVLSASSGAAPPTSPGVPGLPNYADALCLSADTFWAINQQAWPPTAALALPPPLATLKLGRSYKLEILNTTQFPHPFHLHGHTMLVLESSRGDLPQHLCDTVLVRQRERVTVAFVADNPGDWMVHCHIIEHQETGMMGIVRVA